MAYQKTLWIDHSTPINNENLNHMEDGIEAAHEGIAELQAHTLKDTDIDQTLSLEGHVADAAAVGEKLGQLSEEIGNVHSELMMKKFVDITATIPWEIDGFFKGGVLTETLQFTDTAKTSILPVNPGEKYIISGRSNYHQKLLCVYDAEDNILATYSPDYIDTILNDVEVTIPENGVKMSLSYYDVSSLQKFAILKQSFVAKNYILKGNVTKEDTTFFTHEVSDNLADPNAYLVGAFTPNNEYVFEDDNMRRQFVRIYEAGTYVFMGDSLFYGLTQVLRVPVFDIDKNFVETIVGTTDETEPTRQTKVTITVDNPKAAYVGLSICKPYTATTMFVKGSEYPETYMPYFDRWVITDLTILPENIPSVGKNVLHGKIAVFDGDSICHGTSAKDGRSGWAGRIGTENGMMWENCGIGGGTITAEVYTSDGVARHWVSRNIDTIHAKYPSLDYLILEGGTNDADLLGADESKLGALDMTDFSGSYDDTTFIGALESLFYKALTYYPTAKIGYIVAQKMGRSNNGYKETSRRYVYFKTAMEVCDKWGIPYLNLWDGSPLNPSIAAHYDSSKSVDGNIEAGSLYTDGQHLTPTGYDVITSKIEAWMRTL